MARGIQKHDSGRMKRVQSLRAKGTNAAPEQIIAGDDTLILIDLRVKTRDGRVESWHDTDIVPMRLSDQEVDEYLSAELRETFVASNVQAYEWGWKRTEE